MMLVTNEFEVAQPLEKVWDGFVSNVEYAWEDPSFADFLKRLASFLYHLASRRTPFSVR
jgi:hypothetical protein